MGRARPLGQWQFLHGEGRATRTVCLMVFLRIAATSRHGIWCQPAEQESLGQGVRVSRCL